MAQQRSSPATMRSSGAASSAFAQQLVSEAAGVIAPQKLGSRRKARSAPGCSPVTIALNSSLRKRMRKMRRDDLSDS